MQTNLSNTSLFHGSKKFKEIDVNLIQKDEKRFKSNTIGRYVHLTYI